MQKEDRERAPACLFDQVLDARTPEEIIAAKEALRAWLAEYPDELGMRDAFELLSHREDFARSTEASVDSPSGTAATTSIASLVLPSRDLFSIDYAGQ
jgi:hypothetical protein